MSTTISLQEHTKEQLDTVLSDEGHTSQDSVIKTLLLYRELYLQSQPQDATPTFNTMQSQTKTVPPTHHAAPGHKAYIGKIGSGKTVTSKYHIHHQVEANDGNPVMVIDLLEAYTTFTKRHEGTIVKSSDFSPGEFTPPESKQEIRKILTNNSPIGNFPAETSLSTVELFTVQSNATSKPLHEAVLSDIITAVATAAQYDGPVDIYLDEIHYLLSQDEGHAMFSAVLQYASQHDVNIHFVTQTVSELLSDETSSELLNQTRTTFLHATDIDKETQQALGLSNGEVGYITEAHRGTTAPYTEILVGNNGSWTPKRIQLSEDFQKLIDA